MGEKIRLPGYMVAAITLFSLTAVAGILGTLGGDVRGKPFPIESPLPKTNRAPDDGSDIWPQLRASRPSGPIYLLGAPPERKNMSGKGQENPKQAGVKEPVQPMLDLPCKRPEVQLMPKMNAGPNNMAQHQLFAKPVSRVARSNC